MDYLKKQIREDFLANANYLLSILVEDSRQAYIPGGNNGPYLHIESPVRNSCHSLIIFSKCFQLTGEVIFTDAVSKITQYLLSTRYLINDQYIHRQAGPDSCNGVIGDAWVIEALVVAKEVVPEELKIEIDHLLQKIFDRFKFDTKYGFINRVDAIKGRMTPDFTYNHQLWFIASISGIQEFEKIAETFLSTSLEGTLKTNKSGLIHHLYHSNSLKNIYNRSRYKISSIRKAKIIEYKERGYHMFNLVAFVALYKKFPEHSLFSSEKFKSILSYINSGSLDELFRENNKYAIQYNSPGFELPYIVGTFYKDNDEMTELAKLAYSKTRELFWNEEKSAFINNNIDKITFSTRMYELSKLLS